MESIHAAAVSRQGPDKPQSPPSAHHLDRLPPAPLNRGQGEARRFFLARRREEEDCAPIADNLCWRLVGKLPCLAPIGHAGDCGCRP